MTTTYRPTVADLPGQGTIDDFLDALMTGGVPNAENTREAVRRVVNALGVGAAFSASSIRDSLPSSAQRPQIGAFVNRLRRRGYIARDGYAVNTDAHNRNQGRPEPRWRLVRFIPAAEVS